MRRVVDYYLSLNSPWSYFGHARLVEIAARHQAEIHIHPVDFSLIFPVTGGLPVPQRAPVRQAYRLAELERWRKFLGVELNIHPKFWPADETMAANMVVAARDQGQAAIPLAGAYMRAVWAEDRNMADPDTAIAIANECGLDGNALGEATRTGEQSEIRRGESQTALDAGVFGAPSYVLNGEVLWGQDRLDFLDRALGA